MKLDHSLTPYTKVNSKWMKDLDMRQESIKMLEENIHSNLLDISHSKIFMTHLQGKRKKRRNELVGLHQDKNLLHSQETVKKTKRQPTEWEKIFVNDISDKGLVSKIYKELIKLNTQKTNNPVNKWAREGCLGVSVI